MLLALTAVGCQRGRRRGLSRPTLLRPPVLRGARMSARTDARPSVPLLGNAEKGELERLILEPLTDHYDRNGSSALLAEGLRVIVNVNGVALDSGEHPDPLAAVEIRT